MHVRSVQPEAIAAAAAVGRKTSNAEVVAASELCLIAADHLARAALAVGENPMAMTDRRSVLERLATALGHPRVDGIERVMAATTLPTLLLGGDPGGDPDATYEGWRPVLEIPHVRGLVVGRALLYPRDGDVTTGVERAAQLLEGGRHG